MIKWLGVRVQVWSSPASFLDICKERKSFWVEQSGHILVLNAMDSRGGLPVTVGDRILAETSLHGEYAGGLWELLAGLRYLSPEIPNGRVALFSWSAARVCSAGDEDLEGWLGTSMEVDPANYHSPQTPFRLFCSPSMGDVTGRCAKTDVTTAVDGWVWLPAMRPEGLFSASMPRWSPAVFALLDLAVFKERALTEPEKAMLQHFHMVHQSQGTTKLASLKMMAHLLGVDDNSLLQTLEEEFPCFKTILLSTGSACPPEDHVGVPCGGVRWCIQCESALRLLLCSAHTGLLCDYLAAWLSACVSQWSTGTVPQQVVDIHHLPDHQCPSGCIGIIRD